MIKYISLLVILFAGIVAASCSGPSSNPIEPGSDNAAVQPAFETGNEIQDHNKWFSGTIEFDFDSMTGNVILDREPDVHLNLTEFVTTAFRINSVDPVNWEVDVDFTITNKYSYAGYDVRLIIYTDQYGHMLLNADNWTSLYDIPGGIDINPFKAFAEDVPNRKFDGLAEHTENLLIKIPGGNPHVRFAVDVSFPGHAAEPYEIQNFAHDILIANTTSTGIARVEVIAWGDNVNSVKLFCPEVTGTNYQNFTKVLGNQWKLTLRNRQSAPQGDYMARIFATTTTSSALALYDYVKIRIAPPPTEPKYIGSIVCMACHYQTHVNWSSHGHSQVLEAIQGSAPELPYTEVPDPPYGYNWTDITYVLGGYRTKAVFLDQNGRLITGPDTLWMVHNAHFADYLTPERDAIDFECGKCHATAWVSSEDSGGAHEDGLLGIQGIWAEPTVSCEQCHGPGSDHLQDPGPHTIIKDNSAERCGTCHGKDDPDKVYATNGLVKAEQQYNEYNSHGHNQWGCWMCHDSHASSVYDDLSPGEGLVLGCDVCHDPDDHQLGLSLMTGIVDCVDCHMPYASLGGEMTGEGVWKKGDVRTHIWLPDTTGVTLENYFETDGVDTWVKPIDGKIRLNLAYVCFQCHNGEDAFRIGNYAFAANYSDGIHEH